MNLAFLRSWFAARSRWEWTALCVWTAILLFVGVRAFLTPDEKTVYPIFSAAGQLWWTGGELYDPYRPSEFQPGYRYAPTFAVLVTPFAVFPDSIGGVLWRLFSMGALVGALAWLARSVLPGLMSGKQFAWLTLWIIPLSLQSVNNGQANLLVVAAMLGTVAAVGEQRWNLACLLMSVAFIIKLYPLALGMVLVLLHPRALSWRMALAVAASLLLPFFCQEPGYVSDQYSKWIAVLRADDRADILLEHMYRDLWLLIYLYDLPISRSAYFVLQAASGAGVAALCRYRQRADWPTGALLISTLSLTAAWMMLLGPATESSSFVLLAPSLAWSIVSALETPGWRDRRLLLWGSCGYFALAVLLGTFASTVRVHGMGVHSWGSLLYFAYLLTERKPNAAQATAMLRPQRLAA